MSDDHDKDREDLECVEFVELMTAYLDDALSDDLRARIDAHLETCPGCPNAIEQLRTVVNLTGELTEFDVEELDPLEREALLSTSDGSADADLRIGACGKHVG